MYHPPVGTGINTLLASAARTATNSTAYKRAPKHVKGVRIYVEVTAASATPSVVFSIKVKNEIDDTYHLVLDSAAVTGISSNCYEVYPGNALVTNAVASRHIGDGFRVTATHADSDSITYAIRYEWLF